MNALDSLRNWYDTLQARERVMVVITAVVVAITLFYIALWEPVRNGLQQELKKQQSLQTNLAWMQQAAQQVRSLRASGANAQNRDIDSPVSLTLEKTAASSGIKSRIGKLESTGKDKARVRLDNVDFNQMMLWLNTLQNTYGISADSITIDATDKPGLVNARINFSRRS